MEDKIIGIDIDDTLNYSSDIIREYIIRYSNNYSNDNYLINNIDKIMRGISFDEIINSFFRDYCMEMASQMKIKENAKEVIDKLKEIGYKIYIITARSNNYYKNVDEFCNNYLKNNDIYFDKLITAQEHKLDVCKKENVFLMIDDSIDTCELLNENGINGLVFNSQINIEKNTTCDRVDNWNEIYDYVKNKKYECKKLISLTKNKNI